MKIGTKEHYEVLSQFEKEFYWLRLDKEKNKETWKSGNVYENGETNRLYRAYISGYAAGRAAYLS